MLKNISNLGTELNKKEQKQVHGGAKWGTCNSTWDCKKRWENHPIFKNEGFNCWLGQCQIL